MEKLEKIHKYAKEFKEKFFGPGEWCDEPDVIKFQHKGIECIITRICLKEPCTEGEHYFGGYLCGYCKIPKNHPWYKKENIDLDVYGGITFNEFQDDHLIGFDCAHSGDCCPSTELLKKNHPYSNLLPIPEEYKKYSIFDPVYRNIDFCINECKSMAEQIKQNE